MYRISRAAAVRQHKKKCTITMLKYTQKLVYLSIEYTQKFVYNKGNLRQAEPNKPRLYQKRGYIS